MGINCAPVAAFPINLTCFICCFGCVGRFPFNKLSAHDSHRRAVPTSIIGWRKYRPAPAGARRRPQTPADARMRLLQPRGAAESLERLQVPDGVSQRSLGADMLCTHALAALDEGPANFA
jgi:hypothetical protein